MWGRCCFLSAYFSSGDSTQHSQPTYLICIFWSHVPAVQTVRERASSGCNNCTGAFGKGFGLLFQGADGFKDEAPLQLSAALCEITGCGYGGTWHWTLPTGARGKCYKTQKILGTWRGGDGFMFFFLLHDDTPSHPREPAGDLLRNLTWEHSMNQRVARTARASIDEWEKRLLLAR